MMDWSRGPQTGEVTLRGPQTGETTKGPPGRGDNSSLPEVTSSINLDLDQTYKIVVVVQTLGILSTHIWTNRRGVVLPTPRPTVPQSHVIEVTQIRLNMNK